MMSAPASFGTALLINPGHHGQVNVDEHGEACHRSLGQPRAIERGKAFFSIQILYMRTLA
jgi:hypothetical protein